MAVSIQPFIHKRVVVLRETSSVFEAARAMSDNRVGSVVVSDGEGHMTGIVTDRDLACLVLGMNQSPDTEISEIMTRGLASVDESSTVDDVVALMKENGIRRVPVVRGSIEGSNQKCVGLVSIDDLVASKMVSIDDVSDIVRSQVVRRRKDAPHWQSRELHAEKSTDRFLRLFAERSGLNETKSLSVLSLVLGLVVRRLHFTSAADFISMMPERLRSELLDLPAGPDRSIDGAFVLKEMKARFDVDEDQAKRWLLALWSALGESMPNVTEADLADEIPDDLRMLFVALPEGSHPTSAKSNPEAERSSR